MSRFGEGDYDGVGRCDACDGPLDADYKADEDGSFRVCSRCDRKAPLRTTPPDHRDVVLAAEEAESAMRRYAEMLQGWNTPDDEHTRYQLQAVLDEVLREVLNV